MHVAKQTSVIFETMLKGEWLETLVEIGLDEIGTATSFVDYMHERYGESKSSVWYRLKRMKETGLLGFTEKGEKAKPLCLTPRGRDVLRSRMASSENPRVALRMTTLRVAASF